MLNFWTIYKSFNNIHNIQYWLHENWIISWQQLNIIDKNINVIQISTVSSNLYLWVVFYWLFIKYLHTKGIRESLPIGSSELKFKCEIEKQLGSCWAGWAETWGERREVRCESERKEISGWKYLLSNSSSQ